MSNQLVFRGDRMRERRKQLNLTLQEVGDRIGLTRSQINNLELGKSEPSMRALALIAYELSVTSDWLIDLSTASARFTDIGDPIPFDEVSS